MKPAHFSFLLAFGCISFLSCKKDATQTTDTSTHNLVFKFKFDSTQVRLNNIGQPADVSARHAAQSPVFNTMSAHYIELAPTAFTALGSGDVLYKADETTAGGSSAIDFEKANFAGNNEVFYSVPLKNITPGDYEWLRVSLAYQNYDVKFYIDTVINGITFKQDYTGTVASFIGFNTYIKSYKIKNQTLAVNANEKQGYWGFETTFNYAGVDYPMTSSGEAPEGATTVVNPLFASSPIPAGSCVVTAAFTPGKLTITGKEDHDIVIEVSLSTNKSFEWVDVINDGKWEPSKGEQVVDMGIRGMIPGIQ
ncbi:MAG: hypothetical protein QM764_03950 [Chitinophagaceae bacterium]